MLDSREQDKFVIRLPDGLRPQIAATARNNQRSMNGEIVIRLQRSLTQDQLRDEQEKIISVLLKKIEDLEAQEATPCSY
ncbi:Arc family DNA-binding protein [Pseudomonas proteolytica]|uniref:Arc family DNA-binding protein n=1 Tax=Pseudomonas proteolytica TaxID=219574 RepID=UPI0008989AD0|nr:Arc family DNA-binding protein [Pseudomonas proteolytica]KAA8697152.1 Arc family DNA-binding protein [Pseudomonas proteolytica]TWR73505.1 Arc family DNA-binding protein [Pseudomonas proteolytica]SED38232.1 Arc-like DNA binding domain-containing protein [Pseudomonas proteolytica]